MITNKKLGLVALLAGCAVGKIVAGDFNSYAVGDVLVCFRNGGANDLVVDAGPVSTLTGASPNQRISIGQYSAGQINAAFGGANGVDWSAFTWLGDNTLFMTQARSLLNTQTSPYLDANSTAQHNSVLRMATIPTGALAKIAFDPINNTPTAVIEPDSISTYHSGSSYANAWSGSYGGYFNGTFSGSVGSPENTTPGNFSTSGTVVRSDFYQMTPVAGYSLGTFLGYFEMAIDGTLTYVAFPSTVPVIQSISRSGNVSTITFTTGLYGTYSLRGTNTLSSGVAPASWPVVATLSNADPSTVQQYLDTDSGNTKFYFITAQ
jgi:hypothetical protein